MPVTDPVSPIEANFSHDYLSIRAGGKCSDCVSYICNLVDCRCDFVNVAFCLDVCPQGFSLTVYSLTSGGFVSSVTRL